MGLVETLIALGFLAVAFYVFRASWNEDPPPNDPDVRFDDGTPPAAGNYSYAFRGYSRWLDIVAMRDKLASLRPRRKPRKPKA